jgi:steroid 5-alpha reductase family enzyme
LLLLGLAAILILFTVLWAVSLRLENSSIADVAWGPGILVIGLTYYFTSDRRPAARASDAGAARDLGDPPRSHLGIRTRLQGEDFAM